MNAESNRLKRVIAAATLFTLAATLLFGVAFQISKQDPIGPINPFAEDPYDAVGSIAVQVALAGAIISGVRWARDRGEPALSVRRSWLTINAVIVSLASITITLATDALAVALHPLTGRSVWETALIFGLVFVGAVTVMAAIAAASAARRLAALQISDEQALINTLADLFDDALVVAGRTGLWVARQIPLLAHPVAWLTEMGRRLLDWLNRSWISPRFHAWRFCLACGLVLGTWLLTAQLVLEGPPPSIAVALLITAIFLGVEISAVALGYLVFGGWLGIRPPLRAHRVQR